MDRFITYPLAPKLSDDTDEIDDGLRSGQRLLNRSSIRDVADDDAALVLPVDLLLTPLPDKEDRLMAIIQQFPNHIAADKSRSAKERYSHQILPVAIFRCVPLSSNSSSVMKFSNVPRISVKYRRAQR